jgi:hypothetical protein
VLIDIPLNGGLVTQVDEEEVGVNACTELINAEIDKHGQIYKRKGRGAAVTVTSSNIKQILKWVLDGTAYWVITDTVGKIYITTDLTSLGAAKFDGTDGIDIRPSVYGEKLRFACGLSDYPRVYQAIDRSFFWSTHTTGAITVMDSTQLTQFGTSDGLSLAYAGTMEARLTSAGWGLYSANGTDTPTSIFNHNTDVYYYKVTKMYDGNQESPLPDDVLVSSRTSGLEEMPADAYGGSYSPNITANAYTGYFMFTLKALESSWEPRITSLNVYRSKNNPTGPYYKVDTISTLGTGEDNKSKDPTLTRVTNASSLDATIGGTGWFYLTPRSGYTTAPANSDVITVDGQTFTINGTPYYDGYGWTVITNSAPSNIPSDGWWGQECTKPASYFYIYGGCKTNRKILHSTSWNFAVDDRQGDLILIEGNNFGQNATETHDDNSLQSHIVNNLNTVVKIRTAENAWSVNTNNIEVFIHPNYLWKDFTGIGDYSHVQWVDRDFIDGATHPNGSTSQDVRFKYSSNLDGRQYVANVRISDGVETEDHPDWVMFSELLAPDQIPITNYISIADIQGGEITGLARLMGDLVVFQQKGIYRLAIPSADPTSWSLAESEPNLGCNAPDSIVEHQNSVFFAGPDHIYMLNSNFQAIPVTRTIRDTYQSLYTSAARLHIDPKKERLLCRFGASSNTTYVLDLKTLGNSETWTTWDNQTSKKSDLWVTDENFVTHSVEQGSSSYVCELEASSENETTSFTRTTGWIKVGDLDSYKTIKRLNIRYVSTQVIKTEIFIDGDSTAIAWQDGTAYHNIPADTSGQDWYKCKPAIRCKYFKIKLTTTAATSDVEIRRLEVEYE